jgi:hypothetical protein
MELLAFVFVWPFLILVLGLVFISLFDVIGGGAFSGLLFWPVVIIGGIILLNLRGKASKQALSMSQQLEQLRRGVVALSITLLIPVLVRYIILASTESFGGIMIGLVLGFLVLGLGMLISGHKVLSQASVAGGALTLVYTYGQLWQLGAGARIVAAGFGLIVAVGIAIIKLRDRLS